MPIAGLQFDKILVEKLKPLEAPLKINSNLSIKDVSKEDASVKGNACVRFDFVFGLDYTPKQANVELKGHLLFMEKEKEVDSILAEWKKTKKVAPALLEQVLNAVLVKCNIKALLLSQELGLPPHIRMPTLANKSGASNYLG
ncbi:MAG TPA: hypothetical protein HA362_05870 [Nanoarchaeota archaeon]|nr:hypothetical protein [Nanoarchaeota archaeon]